MKQTRLGVLINVGALTGLAAYLAFVVLNNKMIGVPRPSLLTAVLMLYIAGLLWWQGREVKKLVAGEETWMTRLRAARLPLWAKACAIGASAVAGYSAAQVVFCLRYADVALYRRDAIEAGLVAVAAAIAVGVALLVEHWCTLPPDDDDPQQGGSRPLPA